MLACLYKSHVLVSKKYERVLIMNKPYFLIANWKMNLSYHQSLAYIKNLNSLEYGPHPFIVCPSMVSLVACKTHISNTSLKLGAQTCSTYAHGSYTGQTDAQSLYEIGCNYCIIGHSEQRSFTDETDNDIALKAELLISFGIVPIICIGEQKQSVNLNDTVESLIHQLIPLSTKETIKVYTGTILIAYEPLWAIQSGKIPSLETIHAIATTLVSFCTAQFPQATIYILYGGSIDETNASHLISLQVLDGLLIGKTSLDFKKIQNIVSLRNQRLLH